MDNYLTKYEKARILGYRAEQISLGAPPLVDITGMTSALAIAELELAQGKIPLKIRRFYPNGKSREFSVSDLTCT